MNRPKIPAGYRNKRNEILKRMVAIKALLGRHAKAASRNPNEYGHSGDLDVIDGKLREIEEYLA